jgi:hypothetical protein
LKALAEERTLKRYLCVSLEARRRQVGDVAILPLKDFLAHVAAHAIRCKVTAERHDLLMRSAGR